MIDRQHAYVASVAASSNAFGRDYRTEMGAEPPTPFQGQAWLTQWQATFGALPGVELLLVEVREADTGALAYALPLIRRRYRGLMRIEFADCGVTDYNLPLLGPAVPVGAIACRAAWEAISDILPAADILVFDKMPPTIAGMANPLIEALPCAQGRDIGSYVEMGDDYAAWLHSLGKHYRKEFARFWRVFTRAEGARFVRATTDSEATRILHWIEERQSARARSMGLEQDDFRLDQPEFRRFYRELAQDGVAKGNVVITALMAGDEIVAGLFGIAEAGQYAMVRIAIADGEEWANCSPGRLVIERSIAEMHATGYRWFDFTTGDYAYKRTFRTVHVPLNEVTLARSIRGLPRFGLARGKAFIRRRPQLEQLARQMLGLGRTILRGKTRPETELQEPMEKIAKRP